MGRFTKWLFLAAALAMALPAAGQRGFRTAPRELPLLVEQSATIVQGRVVSATVEPHPSFSNIPTVVVTLRVTRAIKGTSAKDEFLQFRQFIWDVRDRADAAGYRKGQEVLLLLNPVNEHGLTSPAGMEQGRFTIRRDRKGVASAVNGFGNAGLFRDPGQRISKMRPQLSPAAMSMLASHQRGPVPLDALLEVISGLAGAK